MKNWIFHFKLCYHAYGTRNGVKMDWLGVFTYFKTCSRTRFETAAAETTVISVD